MFGLLLFLLVGAWLFVLVPMALRGHDNATALRSADRFGDAMRALSRGAGRVVVMPRREGARLVFARTRTERPPVARVSLTAAQRRARLLIGLLVAAVVTLALGVLVSPLLWVLQAFVDLLLVGFVWHLRRMELARQARWTPVVEEEVLVWQRPVRIAGIPDRMPARTVEEVPAAPSSWSPVPVPPPVYVGKPVAPARPARVLDLAEPMYDGQVDEGLELETRRAAGDW